MTLVQDISALIGFFLIIGLIFFLPIFLHRKFSKDYGRIRKILPFVLIGTIYGVLIGEIIPHGLQMWTTIFPYAVFMLFYGWLYKKFSWWKVALSSYLFGAFIEWSIGPQHKIPFIKGEWWTTFVWILILVAPFFLTKIYESSREIKIRKEKPRRKKK